MKQSLIHIGIAASLILTINQAQAQGSVANNSEQLTQEQPADKAQGKRHHRGKPPQTAIDACLKKTAQTSCSFQGPKELEFGVCEDTPDKQYFACKPERKKQ